MDDSSVISVHLVRVWRSGKDIKKSERKGRGERIGEKQALWSTSCTFGLETKITI